MASQISRAAVRIVEESKGFSKSEGRAYLAARAHSARDLARVLGRLKFSGEVSGSWARGDFHLSRATGRSLSDLDLVLPGASLNERLQLAHEAESALAIAGSELRVSVHPSHSFVGMPLADQFRFNLLELLIWPSDAPRDYAMAKALLMLSRKDALETGLDAGLRTGLLASVRIKIGVQQSFSSKELDAESGMVAFAGYALSSRLTAPDVGLAQLAAFFDARAAETGQWIYQHAATKARRAEDCG